MSLHEEALDTYEELESLFFQVLKEKSLTWFGSLITPAPRDGSAPLLSVTKKPYRDLILANSISVFDFRVYLLARQCTLLSSLGRVIDVGSKTVSFLRAFGRRLREIEVRPMQVYPQSSTDAHDQDELPHYFVESWTFSSVMSVVEQIDAWAKPLKFTKPINMSFNAVKGELIELARNQVSYLLPSFCECELMMVSSIYWA